jgi:hypothetical protein
MGQGGIGRGERREGENRHSILYMVIFQSFTYLFDYLVWYYWHWLIVF